MKMRGIAIIGILVIVIGLITSPYWLPDKVESAGGRNLFTIVADKMDEALGTIFGTKRQNQQVTQRSVDITYSSGEQNSQPEPTPLPLPTLPSPDDSTATTAQHNSSDSQSSEGGSGSRSTGVVQTIKDFFNSLVTKVKNISK